MMGNFVRTMLFVYMEFISCELFVGIFAEKRKERSFWLQVLLTVLLVVSMLSWCSCFGSIRYLKFSLSAVS